MTRPLAVGIAGLGTVGAGVMSLLRQNADIIAARAGRPIAVVAVSARDRGRDRGVPLSGLRWYEDAAALAEDAGVDVVVECIGGANGIARTLAEATLSRGKPLVTANKALLAVHGAALPRLAEERSAPLLFEAAVAGGIPAIKAVREGLAANRIHRVMGILNGTCNFILTMMRERGREFAEALHEAQKLGYAEADPSMDVDGVDAAHKLAILAAIAFGRPRRLRGRAHRGNPRRLRPSTSSWRRNSATASSCWASPAAAMAASRRACTPPWCRWRIRSRGWKACSTPWWRKAMR